MNVSLQALERATDVAAHEWVLKGLVVESATSARLVLLVNHPKVVWPWECWVSPCSEQSFQAFVNIVVLAALANGRQLADMVVLRDGAGNGPAWQGHLEREAIKQELREEMEAEVARELDELYGTQEQCMLMQETEEGLDEEEW
jgi:hypothetical protein